MLRRRRSASLRQPQRYVYIKTSNVTPIERNASTESLDKAALKAAVSAVEKEEVLSPTTPKALKCINSKDIVFPKSKYYKPIVHESQDSVTDDPSTWNQIWLEFPAPDARECFLLAEPNRKDEYNPLNDLKVTAQRIILESIPQSDRSIFGDINDGILRAIIKACNRKSAKDLEAAVGQFNAAMIAWRARNSGVEQTGVSSPNFVDFVLEQTYGRAVSPRVNILKSYKGFSNFVYGEVKSKFVTDLIEKSGLQSHHCFLDMGSGVGSVVLQVAAQTLCEAYGIEVMDNPANLAKQHREEFICRMQYYKKPCGKITLRHGDFLEDEEIHNVMKRADVIFVNNYAFNAELNQGLLARFLDLKPTAKVISLKSFTSLEKRQAGRRSNAIENIFTVKEYYFGQNSVSWMSEAGRFYVHTLQRG